MEGILKYQNIKKFAKYSFLPNDLEILILKQHLFKIFYQDNTLKRLRSDYWWCKGNILKKKVLNTQLRAHYFSKKIQSFRACTTSMLEKGK